MANDVLTPAVAGSKVGRELAIMDAVVMPETLGGMIDFAQVMCKADVAIPAHLRGNPGACLAVAMRARAWRMDPFAVSTKTYSVNDILAFESQLIAAVINRCAPIKGRLVPVYKGTGESRQCVLEPEATDGQKLPYESPKKADIKPQNSPLWKSDPDQQLFYYSSRAWARRYFPELLLGVYDPEEARAAQMRDITPSKVDNFLDDGDGVARLAQEAPKTQASKVDESKTIDAVATKIDETVDQGELNLAPGETIDRETGEILEDVKPDPELIARNLAKAAGSFSSLAMFEAWLEEVKADIAALETTVPAETRAAVLAAVAAARKELEGF